MITQLMTLATLATILQRAQKKYSKLTIRKLFERTDILKTYPKAGREVPEKNDENVRELIEGSYRIIYEIVSPDQINILAVYHSARDLKS